MEQGFTIEAITVSETQPQKPESVITELQQALKNSDHVTAIDIITNWQTKTDVNEPLIPYLVKHTTGSNNYSEFIAGLVEITRLAMLNEIITGGQVTTSLSNISKNIQSDIELNKMLKMHDIENLKKQKETLSSIEVLLKGKKTFYKNIAKALYTALYAITPNGYSALHLAAMSKHAVELTHSLISVWWVFNYEKAKDLSLKKIKIIPTYKNSYQHLLDTNKSIDSPTRNEVWNIHKNTRASTNFSKWLSAQGYESQLSTPDTTPLKITPANTPNNSTPSPSHIEDKSNIHERNSKQSLTSQFEAMSLSSASRDDSPNREIGTAILQSSGATNIQVITPTQISTPSNAYTDTSPNRIDTEIGSATLQSTEATGIIVTPIVNNSSQISVNDIPKESLQQQEPIQESQLQRNEVNVSVFATPTETLDKAKRLETDSDETKENLNKKEEEQEEKKEAEQFTKQEKQEEIATTQTASTPNIGNNRNLSSSASLLKTLAESPSKPQQEQKPAILEAPTKPALHQATLRGNHHLIIILAQENTVNDKDFTVKKNPNSKDLDNIIILVPDKTALHIATEIMDLVAIKLLIKAGADISVTDSENNTILHIIAAQSNVVEKEKFKEIGLYFLSELKAKFSKNILGQTPLHIAALGGDIEAVKLLHQNDPDPDALINKDNKNNTALHLAILGRHEDVIDYLADSMCSKDHKFETLNQDGHTVLHLAAQRKLPDLIKKLVKLGAKINAPTPGPDGKTTLNFAIESGDMDTIEAVLSCGLRINTKDPNIIHPAQSRTAKGEIIIHLCCRYNKIELCEQFLSAGADVTATNISNMNPLHIAAQTGNIKLVELLIKHTKKQGKSATVLLNAADELSNTPLHYAAMSGNIELFLLLTKHGDSVSLTHKNLGQKTPLTITDKNGDCIIHHIDNDKHVSLVKLYGDKGCLETPNLNGQNALHIASARNLPNCINQILKQITNSQNTILPLTDNLGRNALMTAILHGAKDTIKALKKIYPAIITAGNKDEINSLHFAAIHDKNGDIFKLLFNKEHIETLDKMQRTPLHHAAAAGNVTVYNLLLKEGAKFNAIDAEGNTVAHHVMKSNDPELVDQVLKNTKNLAVNAKAENCFHYLFKYGTPEVAKLVYSQHSYLQGKSTDVEAVCFHYALAGKNTAMFIYLVENKYPIKLAFADAQGKLLVHLAIEFEQLKELKHIMATNSNTVSITVEQLITPDKSGATPIYYLAKSKSSDLITYILQDCIIVKARTETVTTQKTEKLQANEIESLQKSNATEDVPTEITIQEGHSEIRNDMLNMDYAIAICKAHNETMQTPLHVAILDGSYQFTKQFVMLLNLCTNNRKDQPLQLRKLLSAQDKAGNSPLHIAVHKKDKRTVELLLKNHIQLDLVTKYNKKTALEFATEELEKLNKQLKQFESPPEKKEKQTTIISKQLDEKMKLKEEIQVLTEIIGMISEKAKVKEIMQNFTKDSFDINATDANGNTILHHLAQQQDSITLKFVLKHGHALINVKNNTGQTPLHIVAAAGNSELVALLLSVCPDMSLRVQDSNGNTPAHCAAIANHLDLATQILERDPLVSATSLFDVIDGKPTNMINGEIAADMINLELKSELKSTDKIGMTSKDKMRHEQQQEYTIYCYKNGTVANGHGILVNKDGKRAQDILADAQRNSLTKTL